MYLITDMKGFIAGKLHRDPADKQKIITLWSSKRADAVRYDFREVAELIAKKIGKSARVIVE